MTLQERLRQHRVILKSGDYNGADLMAAWCDMVNAADALDAKDARIRELIAALEYWIPDESMLPDGYSQDAMSAWDRHIKILQRARAALEGK